MYIHFTFEDGSNPYISTSDKKLLEMIRNYYTEQTGKNCYHVTGRFDCRFEHGNGKPYTAYEHNKEILRNFAIDWQYNFCEYDWLTSELIEWGEFFREYGKRYGLLREFKENGII